MERVIVRGPGFCAVTEDGVLVEYLQRDASQGGDILGGTVERMMPGIGGAFVSIGRKKAGFLPLRENSQSFAAEPLRSGTRIPVQVKKEETGGKGAFLTRDLTLAGTYVLLMPLNRYIGVSSRIQAEEDRSGCAQSAGSWLNSSVTGLWQARRFAARIRPVLKMQQDRSAS